MKSSVAMRSAARSGAGRQVAKVSNGARATMARAGNWFPGRESPAWLTDDIPGAQRRLCGQRDALLPATFGGLILEEQARGAASRQRRGQAQPRTGAAALAGPRLGRPELQRGVLGAAPPRPEQESEWRSAREQEPAWRQQREESRAATSKPRRARHRRRARVAAASANRAHLGVEQPQIQR